MIIKEFFTTLILMAAIDGIWLGKIATKFYRSQLGKMMLAKPNWSAAFAFYVIYVVGIVYFVVSPALNEGSASFAFWRGAMFGFVAYATYDLTNLATLKGFRAKLAIFDLIWGSFLTAIVGLIAFLILN